MGLPEAVYQAIKGDKFEKLDLSIYKLDTVELEDILKLLATSKKLASLDISKHTLEANAISYIIQITSLYELKACKCKITDKGFSVLAHHPTLIAIDLFNNTITDKGIEEFLKINSAPQLVMLNLSSNKITTDGVRSLVKFRKLFKLSIRINEIEDDAVSILCHHPTLVALDLWRTRVTDKGATYLLNNNNLTWLDLRESKVGQLLLSSLAQHIERNKQEAIIKRQIFICAIVVIAANRMHETHLSYFHSLPLDLIFHIISFMNFTEMEKTQRQGLKCARFIFNNINQIEKFFHEKIPLKIIERPVYSLPTCLASKFSFFLPKSVNIHLPLAINSPHPSPSNKRMRLS